MKKLLLAASLLAFAQLGNAQQAQEIIAEKLIDFPAMNLEAALMHPIGGKLLVYAKINNTNFELWSHDLATGTTTKIDDNIYNYDLLFGFQYFEGYVHLNGKYYTAPAFNVGTNSSEKEPYVTDGTPGGSQVLADINPNSGTNYYSSDPRAFTVFDNHVIFGGTGPSMQNVWKHDGINPPTPIVGQHSIFQAIVVNNEMLYLGRANNVTGLAKLTSANSAPQSLMEFYNSTSLTQLGNKAIFYAEKSGSGVGYELYITDGTSAGTTLLKDLVPGNGSPVKPTSYISNNGNPKLFAVLNNVAYFSFQNPSDSKYYLYRTDGTPAGTYQLMENPTLIRDVFRVGNHIAFAAWDVALNKRRTYVTNGGAPVPLTDGGSGFYAINPGVIHGDLSFNNFNAIITEGSYTANGTTSFSNLIVSNGTTAGTKTIDVKDASGNMVESWIDDLTFIGDRVYFTYNGAVYQMNVSTILSAESGMVAENKISVYPNPAKSTVFISASAPVNADVFTVTGQLAASYKNTQTLDVKNLPAGVYALHITDAKGQLIKTERLVKVD